MAGEIQKMGTKSGNTSKIAACILMTVNLVVMTSCIVLFGFSLWIISSPGSLSVAIRAGGKTSTALLPPESLSIQSGVGAAAVALFLFVIAFMGFYGAVSRSQFLLLMYASLVLLLLMLECALLFYFTSNLIEKGLQEEDGQWAHYTRLAFRCCDFNASKYRDAAKPPWSCCGVDSYPDNCTIPDAFSKVDWKRSLLAISPPIVLGYK